MKEYSYNFGTLGYEYNDNAPPNEKKGFIIESLIEGVDFKVFKGSVVIYASKNGILAMDIDAIPRFTEELLGIYELCKWRSFG